MKDVTEHVASKLYTHRYGKEKTWESFKSDKPDIAEIYRENARVAVRAYQEATAGR